MNSLRTIVESKVLPFVEKPMRYVGSELNIIRKKYTECSVHGVLCFPDLYDIGMSHFGMQMLYHIVNQHPRWALSRSFHPWGDMEKKLRELKIPLYTLEYFSPLSEADWIGFSVQYELQYTNILNMLDLSGLAVRSSERSPDDPIIVAGGPCVGNPEPLGQFIDVFAIGDGEEQIINLYTTIENEKSKNSSKSKILGILSEFPGLYVPSIQKRVQQEKFLIPCGHKKVDAVKVMNLRNEYYPTKPIVPLMEVVHHRLAVEVMRGCTRGCRFCAAGMWYRPVRERSSSDIIGSIKTGIHSTGWRSASLLSLSTADYSCLFSLLDSAAKLKADEHIQIALPSTRVDSLSDNELEMLDRASPLTSLTIAPEAGSERLRKVINKDFTNEVIYTIVEKLLARNIQSLKLYFMIGLPTENDDDIEAIIQMIVKISGMVRSVAFRREVHVALSPFSPKAHTPFQRERMESVSNLEIKSKAIKNACKYLKNVKVSYRDPKITLLETVMARGDYSVGDMIFLAWKDGARFDGWDEFFDIKRWHDAACSLNTTLEAYCEPIPDNQLLPWNLISSGISDEFLQAERDKAYKEMGTQDCRNECVACGVCGETLQTSIAKSTSQPVIEEVKNVKRLQVDQKQYRYRLWFQKGESLRFLGHIDMSALVHRAFLMAGVKLAYSMGYHPHPRISFGPPLPLGVCGLKEAFDVITVLPLNDFTRINKLLPNDLSITSIETVNNIQKSLFDSIKSAHYTFTPLFTIDIMEIQSIISAFMALNEYRIVNIKKDRKIEKNIRNGIQSIVCETVVPAFKAELLLGQGKGCKPLELISALFPDRLFSDFQVERVSCTIT